MRIKGWRDVATDRECGPVERQRDADIYEYANQEQKNHMMTLKNCISTSYMLKNIKTME
jgi:hypothetical protein